MAAYFTSDIKSPKEFAKEWQAVINEFDKDNLWVPYFEALCSVVLRLLMTQMTSRKTSGKFSGNCHGMKPDQQILFE